MNGLRVIQYLATLAFLMAATACTTSVEAPAGSELETLAKSPNDQREYSTFTLANDLQVVLISDPTLEVSGASLSVGVGSYENPEEFPGLAHYLEHMLFLGTEKYPEANSFQTYVQENGGFSDAYTATDHTNFFFQIGEGAFDQALNRYSDYFKSPTFDKTYSDKERNAVNSEWSMGKSDDARIINRLRGVTANPEHPAQRMSVGNLTTLVDQGDTSLYSAMKDFYQRYYSSNNMKLVLFGKQKSATLQALAEQHFSAIANKNIQPPVVSVTGLTDLQSGEHIYYQPQKPTRQMVIEFPLKNNSSQWRVKPNRYVANLLSSEEPGTAAEVLRKKGWIDNFTVSDRPDYYGKDGIFSINIGLTEKGIAHQDEIIATVFKYLDLIRTSGVDSVYYQEYKAMLAKQYEDLQVPNPLNQAVHFSQVLFTLPAQHLNDAFYTYQQFDAKAVKAVLAQLTPQRARVWHISPEAEVDTKIPYYEGQYRVQKFDPAELDRWQTLGQTTELQLPAENDLFSTDKAQVVDASIMQPRQVVDQPGIEAWLVHSEYHQSEHGYLQVMFNTDLPLKSAKNNVMSDLVNRIFALQTTALRDKAGRAGIGMGIERPKNNHALTLSGYSEKHPLLYQRLLQRWVNMAFNEQEFTIAKQGFSDWLDGRAKEEPSRQLFTELNRLMVDPSWTDQALANALEEITLEDIKQYQKDLVSDNRVRIFAFGNYNKANVKEFASITQATMPNTWQKQGRYFAPVTKPVIGEHTNYRGDIAKTDNGLLQAYYSDDTSLDVAAQLFLLNSIFQQAFYNQLRTEEQVGYVVGSSIDRIGDYWGFILYAQTTNTELADLSDRFNQFVADYWSELQALDNAVLEQLRATVIAQINQPPGNFYEEYPKYLNDFYRGNDKFDTRARLIKAIKNTTKAGVVARYKALMLEQNAYRVDVELQGTQAAQPAD
jgi:protease-3